MQSTILSLTPDNHWPQTDITNRTITKLEFYDLNNKWEEIPTPRSLNLPKLKTVSIRVDQLKVFPSFLVEVADKIEVLEIYRGKLNQVPELIHFTRLNSLQIWGSGTIKPEPLFKILSVCKTLKHLRIDNLYGKKIPLELLTKLEIQQLSLGNKLLKKTGLEIAKKIATFPKLKTLALNLQNIPLTEDILHLKNIPDISFTYLYKQPSYMVDLPFYYLQSSWREDEFTTNFKLTQTLPEFIQRKLAFSHLTNNNEFDDLADAHWNRSEISFTDTTFFIKKPKSWKKKEWENTLQTLNLKVEDSPEKAELVFYDSDIPFPEFVEHIKNGKTLISTGRLLEYIENNQDKWLLANASEDALENVYKLLASGSNENMEVAFQILEGGGISKKAMGMIGAIALTHSDKKIAAKAKKIYLKRASNELFDALKGSSLRRSKGHYGKVNMAAKVQDIDFPLFALKAHNIAANNPNIGEVRSYKFEIQDLDFDKLPREIEYFSSITTLILDGKKTFDLNNLFQVLATNKHIKVLSMEKCQFTIDQDLDQVNHLEEINLNNNKLLNTNFQNFRKLRRLEIAKTGITDLSFLSKLTTLQHLNLSHLKLKEIPDGVYELNKLQVINAKQNKISTIDTLINCCPQLSILDFTQNKIQHVPHEIWGLSQLKEVRLRSNSISSEKQLNIADVNNRSLEVIDLARNKLSTLAISGRFPNLRYVDVSFTGLEAIHPTLIRNTRINQLFAQNNNITELPAAFGEKNYIKVNLANNQITELPAWIAQITISNFDVSKNNISKVHPDLDKYGNDGYARLYWKADGNPFTPPHYRWGGMYW